MDIAYVREIKKVNKNFILKICGGVLVAQASIVPSLVDVGFLKFDVGGSYTRLISSLAPFDPKSKRFFSQDSSKT